MGDTLLRQRCKSGTWAGTQTHSTKANLPKSLPYPTHGNHHAVRHRPTL